MAKVRIQARSGLAEDSTGDGCHFPLGHHERATQVGALDILARVWKREGFIGWYQVSKNCINLSYDKLKWHTCALGDAGTDYKSSSVTGPVVHVKRAI